MKKTSSSYSLDTVFVMTLFLIFALTVLSVLMSGANVYKNTVKTMNERYQSRTCISYISAKVRHSNPGSVYITDFDGVKTLALSETANDSEYLTYIYYYDGYVKELYFEKGLDFTPSDGQDILKMNNLSFADEGKMIKVECTDTDNEVTSVLISNTAGGDALA